MNWLDERQFLINKHFLSSCFFLEAKWNSIFNFPVTKLVNESIWTFERLKIRFFKLWRKTGNASLEFDLNFGDL